MRVNQRPHIPYLKINSVQTDNRLVSTLHECGRTVVSQSCCPHLAISVARKQMCTSKRHPDIWLNNKCLAFPHKLDWWRSQIWMLRFDGCGSDVQIDSENKTPAAMLSDKIGTFTTGPVIEGRVAVSGGKWIAVKRLIERSIALFLCVCCSWGRLENECHIHSFVCDLFRPSWLMPDVYAANKLCSDGNVLAGGVNVGTMLSKSKTLIFASIV